MSLSDNANDKWCVIRQDKNDVLYLESPNVSKEIADQHARHREKEIGFHGQSVWVERYPPADPNILRP